MYFGMFGSIFLLSQFFQTAQGYSPFEAGLRVLPWTAMPMIVAPIAGALSDRIGGRPFLAGGLALQAIGLGWIAAVSSADVGYSSLIGPFIVSGIGMGMFFAPVANIVLSAVGLRDEGKASGASNAIREVGGVFGVAVLASIFAARAATSRRRSSTRVSSRRPGSAPRSSASVPWSRSSCPARRASRSVCRRSRRPRAAVRDVSQGQSLGHVPFGRQTRSQPAGSCGTGQAGSGRQSSQPVGNGHSARTRSASARTAAASSRPAAAACSSSSSSFQR